MNINEDPNTYRPDPNRPAPVRPAEPANYPAPDSRVNPDSNPDPITGEPGARPVGTGVGAAGAGAVGTAVGVIVGGPIGGAVGAVVGSVAGGLLGKGIAETIDPTVEDRYWRENYSRRPYVDPSYTYDDYSPAYRTGYEGYSTYYSQGLSYQDAEPQLRQRYEREPGANRLHWDKARHASQDAWYRLEHKTADPDAERR
ncbi:hypothetical protein PGN35_002355 [Nodosilinea sp. PGN35]|uniref:hypothetical protein n=1 Tax=Nodosilinea sp. PGN35 TaxID=3020489 RepID=UPI0023B270A1|nr:hypothetical protein [Nodosilinea sp. TSF1-S3]MDF0368750.1 hypothetical protein [Nodosilinea sp. TSF1-S3]